MANEPEPPLASEAPARKGSSGGLIIRQKEPVNLESPFDRLDYFLTPVDLFYIRNHFPVPKLDAATYELRIDGEVQNPFSLSYAALRDLPSVTRPATLECAGNGRVFLVPQAEGAQWELGAVGNAEWTGVPLRDLLLRAGISDSACEVVLEGADRGEPKEKPTPPGTIPYSRSLPREKALQPEVLIAYAMNGRDLPPEHGFPIRAIVPGHYGMASVKWLTHILAVREPFPSYWQTSDYAYWDYFDGKPVRRALGEMMVKSQIARPGMYEAVAPGQLYVIAGAAWSGESEIAEVSVSTDAGETWNPAELLDRPQRHTWARWQLNWQVPSQPGARTLLSRAKDAKGRVQPDKHDPHYGSYGVNQCLPIQVFVR